jgi:predicted DNA-binding transcriptional regulator YafY
VVGRDVERDGDRAFRVDRFDANPELGPPDAFESRAGVDPGDLVRGDPMSYGDDAPMDAQVLVGAARAAWVIDELGEPAVVERRDDGSVVVELAVVNRDAFRTWVLGLLDHAEVLGPSELRDDIVRWLRELSGA